MNNLLTINLFIFISNEVTNENWKKELSKIENLNIILFKNKANFLYTIKSLNINPNYSIVLTEIKEGFFLIDEAKTMIENILNQTVIFCSRKSNLTTSEISELLIKGATDIIDIEIEPLLLAAKMRSYIRLTLNKKLNQKKTLIISSDNKIKLDTEKRSIIVTGKEVPLTERETAIISLLMMNENEIVTKLQIADLLWSENIQKVNPNVIDKHIQNIRVKIPYFSYRIKTVYGKGYVFKTEG